jgi:hypothetical protein
MRTFATHPDDLRLWDRGVHHGLDGWYYGTVWGFDNKIDAEVRIKALQQARAAADPMAMYTAVAVAQLQEQVEALTELVESIEEDLQGMILFLHI